jgi:hypothetical protein
MDGRAFLQKHWAGLTLAAIVFGATAVAAVWAFIVPIFQAPDEPYHFDYVLCLNAHHRPFRVRGMPPVFPLYLVHPYCPYLWERTGGEAVIRHPDVRMPPGYGSAQFFSQINRDAPGVTDADVQRAPCYLAFYSCGYYALAAAWLGLLRLVHAPLVALFFGTRLLSTLLLPASLLCCYGSARESGLERRRALFLTGCIGFFPLVSFVASYVQPDNLSLFLVTASWFLALRAKRTRWPLWTLVALGLCLGWLLLTKQHFFLCVALPVVGLFAMDIRRLPTRERRVLPRALALLGPSVIASGIYVWSAWGTVPYYAGRASGTSSVGELFTRLSEAFIDFYQGTTHLSFWGIFGCLDTPLIFHSVPITDGMRAVIQVFTWVVLGLTLVRFGQIAVRLIGLVRRGRLERALRLGLSHPVLNSYFLFTVFMFFIYIWTNNGIGSQGRHWLPFVLPIFLTACLYAPAALGRSRLRAMVSGAVMAALAVYVLAGSGYALRSVCERYYGQAPSTIANSPAQNEILVCH